MNSEASLLAIDWAQRPIEEQLGQRLMVGFDGDGFNGNLKFMIDTLKIGGVILFTRNVKTPQQLGELCGSIQAYADECGLPPLFISIDQEGGPVARLKAPFSEFPGNSSMRSIDDAIDFAQTTADELKAVGINMNMAPVMDVPPPEMNSIMANRAFGDSPAKVSEYGCLVIDHMQRKGIMAIGKHFPGIGRTTIDSHIERPISDVRLPDLAAWDLVPFAAAIEQGVAGMMLSHIFYPAIDAQWPASLSKLIARDLLRDRMGFEGLIITDDLDMGAIVNHYDVPTAINRIMWADIDIALICHQSPKIEQAFESLLTFHSQSPYLQEGNLESLQRLMRFKQSYLIGSA
jgi:beta-N-acetylhexosaminidase